MLAWHHPVWPGVLLTGFFVFLVLTLWRPGVWLCVVPASLPLLNFSPWTGWLMIEEFDILLLGVLAGGYGRRMFWPSTVHAARTPYPVLWLLGSWVGVGLCSLARGLLDVGRINFDWFASYTDAMNSLRVFKSLAFALLLIPLLAQETNTSVTRSNQRLALGMAIGLTGVTLAVLWERVAFPGWLNFSAHYRTVALFWEMHVGGAALDSYLALATPFVVWALVTARRPVLWAGAAMLAMLTAYACLTTFSRGVYAAVAGSLLLLTIFLWAQKGVSSERIMLNRAVRNHSLSGWRTKSDLMLSLLLMIEVATVLGGGTFMRERLGSADRDLDSRVAHWQQGLDLLVTPTDWLLGIGLGRVPAHYARQGASAEFSGAVTLGHETNKSGRRNAYVTIQGPPTLPELGGLYALTQRVVLAPKVLNYIRLNARAQQDVDVLLKLCERHLLYDENCQTNRVHVAPRNSEWQSFFVALDGPLLTDQVWYAPRLGMFSVSVINAGGRVDIDNVSLIGAPASMLENEDFSEQLAHWFPAAQFYFLPWHIDNLYLEILIERGLIGIFFWTALLLYTLWILVFGRARLQVLSPYLAASLCAVLIVGLMSSFMEISRVSFLFYVLIFYSLSGTERVHNSSQIGLKNSS